MSKLSAATGLYHERQVLQLRAKGDFQAAQRAYEKAAAAHMPTAERLRRAAEKAKAYWARRRSLTQRAREDVDRLSVPALKPERTKISPCRSSRNGTKPQLIVLHITVSHNRPGLADLDGVLDYFGRLPTQASSHVVNDAEGHDARCVPDEEKAWTQAAFNSVGLSIEQIEYADKPRSKWLSENKAQLENTAAWVAYWSHKYGIPLEESTTHGVCQHRDLGQAGGGHVDCGPNYPIDYVLKRARAIRSAKYGS